MEKPAILQGKPLLNEPYLAFNAIGEEEKQAVARVMDERILSDFVGRAGNKFLGGKYVRLFEEEIKKRFGISYAVSFNSATTALQAAIAATGIGPGDEIITSPYTMSATASAILFNGAVPVFADIDPETYCLDPVSVENQISERTKAIISVNIFGGSADYDALKRIIKEHSLYLIEDNAQAIGGSYKGRLLGTIGDLGILSFNVHKHIQCGEGGVLITDDKELAFRAQLVRNHGEAVIDDLHNESSAGFEAILGSNFRLSELHAAVAAEQLKKMDRLNTERIALAEYLTKRLREFKWLAPAYISPQTKHVFYVYPFKFFSEQIGLSRTQFAKAMKAENFPLNEGYLKPLYLMPLYQRKQMYPRSQFPFVSSEYPHNISYEKGICPVAERLFEKELLFTTICHTPRTKQDIDLFVRAIQRIEAHADEIAAYVEI